MPAALVPSTSKVCAETGPNATLTAKMSASKAQENNRRILVSLA